MAKQVQQSINLEESLKQAKDWNDVIAEMQVKLSNKINELNDHAQSANEFYESLFGK